MMKKQKLIWQIFPFFLVIIIVSLSLEAWYFNRHSRDFFLENTEKELIVRARLIKFKIAGMLLDSPVQQQQINDLCKDLGEAVQTRITVIIPSGEVIADSFAQVSTMESHKTGRKSRPRFPVKRGGYPLQPDFGSEHDVYCFARGAGE